MSSPTPAPPAPAHMGPTEAQKWSISAWSALVAALVFSPFAYNLTNGIAQMIGMNTVEAGAPTMFGLIIHALVYMVLVRLMMNVNLPGVN